MNKHKPIVEIKFPERFWFCDKDTGAINSYSIRPKTIDDADYKKKVSARRKEALAKRKKAKACVSNPKLRNRAA